MKRLLGAAATIMLVSTMFLVAGVGHAPKAISDMTTLDCTVPSPYAMYDEMCGTTTDEYGQSPDYVPNVAGCIWHSEKLTKVGTLLTGGDSAGCYPQHHIYISGTIWWTNCPDFPPGSQCPATMMFNGDKAPARKTCSFNTYCEVDPQVFTAGCHWYWNHVYVDITGIGKGKAWSKSLETCS